MIPTNLLRGKKKRASLLFYIIQFIFPAPGNSTQMTWFLKKWLTPTLIAHIKKSDIRGKKQQDKTLSSFGKHWFYISLCLPRLLMHTPLSLAFATHFILQMNRPCLNGPTPALWLGISSFTFSCHEALLVSSLPSLYTSYIFLPGVISSHLTYILSWSICSIFQDVQEN